MRHALKALSSGGSLSARAARGGLYLSGAAAVDQAARFLKNVILARMLVPEDFGLMALVVAAAGAFEALTDLGVRQSVIQDPSGSRAPFLNAAWWLSSARGAAVYAVALLAAPLVARFYGRVELVPLLRVALAVALVRGLVSPRLHVLEKEMRFGRWAAVSQGGSLAGVLVAVALALWTANVWALVFGLLAEAFVRTALSFALCPFRPVFSLDRDSLRRIMVFSKGMLGLPILMMVFFQLPVFVVGKVLPVGDLGVFTLAYGLANVPFMLFSMTAAPLMLPAFVRLMDDRPRLTAAVSASLRAVAVCGLPVAAFLCVFARPLLHAAYGPRYSSGASTLAVLSCVAVLMAANSCIGSLFFGLGLPGVHRRYSAARVALLVVGIVPLTVWLGAPGAALAILLSLALPLFFQAARLSDYVSLTSVRIGASLADGLLLGVAVLVCGLAARAALGPGHAGLAAGGLVCATAIALGVGRFAVQRLRARETRAGAAPPGRVALPAVECAVADSRASR